MRPCGPASARRRWDSPRALASTPGCRSGSQVILEQGQHVANGGAESAGAGQRIEIDRRNAVVLRVVPGQEAPLLLRRQRDHGIGQLQRPGDLVSHQFGQGIPARLASACPRSPNPRLLYRNCASPSFATPCFFKYA